MVNILLSIERIVMDQTVADSDSDTSSNSLNNTVWKCSQKPIPTLTTWVHGARIYISYGIQVSVNEP